MQTSTNQALQGLKTENFAAEYLGVKPSTLRRWRMANTGPRPIRVGSRAIRYEVSALDAYLDECRKASNALPGRVGA